jgi:hypothetical protein
MLSKATKSQFNSQQWIYIMTSPIIIKPYGGTIRSWCRHVITQYVPEELLAERLVKDADFKAEYFTGEVLEDKLDRWRSGDAMRSSLIVKFDENTLLVETENTLYQLVGPGRISNSRPKNYASEVSKTILLLSQAKGLKTDDSESFIVYPKTTSS